MESSDRTVDQLARELAAAELLASNRRLSDHARALREAGLAGAAELSTAAAGLLGDAFRALTGRHPGEVEL